MNLRCPVSGPPQPVSGTNALIASHALGFRAWIVLKHYSTLQVIKIHGVAATYKTTFEICSPRLLRRNLCYLASSYIASILNSATASVIAWLMSLAGYGTFTAGDSSQRTVKFVPRTIYRTPIWKMVMGTRNARSWSRHVSLNNWWYYGFTAFSKYLKLHDNSFDWRRSSTPAQHV